VKHEAAFSRRVLSIGKGRTSGLCCDFVGFDCIRRDFCSAECRFGSRRRALFIPTGRKGRFVKQELAVIEVREGKRQQIGVYQTEFLPHVGEELVLEGGLFKVKRVRRTPYFIRTDVRVYGDDETVTTKVDVYVDPEAETDTYEGMEILVVRVSNLGECD
jgi:hypothetical protein